MSVRNDLLGMNALNRCCRSSTVRHEVTKCAFYSSRGGRRISDTPFFCGLHIDTAKTMGAQLIHADRHLHKLNSIPPERFVLGASRYTGRRFQSSLLHQPTKITIYVGHIQYLPSFEVVLTSSHAGFVVNMYIQGVFCCVLSISRVWCSFIQVSRVLQNLCHPQHCILFTMLMLTLGRARINAAQYFSQHPTRSNIALAIELYVPYVYAMCLPSASSADGMAFSYNIGVLYAQCLRRDVGVCVWVCECFSCVCIFARTCLWCGLHEWYDERWVENGCCSQIGLKVHPR